jgi:AAA ATPase domain
MKYSPPKTIPEVLHRIEFNRGLSYDDPRFVDTAEARGSQQTLSNLSRRFGLFDGLKDVLAKDSTHVLFMGHTGSGKSTELARYAHELAKTRQLYVVPLDISQELDENNLTIEELLITMLKLLLEQLSRQNIACGEAELRALYDWSAERTREVEHFNLLETELKTGAEAKYSFFGLAKVYAQFTASFKSGGSHKEKLREKIQQLFSQFRNLFIALLSQIEGAIKQAGLGERVLFIIDGTDKLVADDRKRLFVDDAHKLFSIPILAVYAASIDFAYGDGIPSNWEQVKLPMIKLKEKDGKPHAAGHDTMRQMLLQRADRCIFASETVLDLLIEKSGGHARDLIRLLKTALEYVPQGDLLTLDVVQYAIPYYARERAAFMSPEHFAALAKIDADMINYGNPEEIKLLLYKLVVLEYNDSTWRTSHPILRELPGYIRAKENLAKP